MGGTSGVIPCNMVAFIGGLVWETHRYVLWKDGNLLVIQAETAQDIEDPNWIDSNALQYKLVEEENFQLGLIQSLLSGIEFGKTNWAYLIRSSGGHRIVQKERSLHKISCPLWATLIHEDEIEVTKWVDAAERRGVWNGKPVDVFYGWDDQWLKRVESAMHGLRAIRDLDLTFEIYGHLVGRNGEVVGIVSEAAWGRTIALGDRTLVYETFARLQEHGCLFVGISTGQVLIADGKVRLLDLYGIRPYSEDDRAEMESKAEIFHWRELEIIFAQLESGYPLSYNPRFWHQTPRMLLASTPSPERPRLMSYMHLGLNGYHDRWKYDLYGNLCDDNSSATSAHDRDHGAASKRHRKTILHDDLITPLPLSVDSPKRIAVSRKAIISCHRKRNEQIVSFTLFHPYRQRIPLNKPLPRNDNSDATSDSEISICSL
ncbi:hypothetical protein K443DRAFT_392021 [Laccaria amethystina LaAM-08-1]|uniref:Uncharacterized protein n=1 Tax=Laccaria amethystina LaAM-08-1 TaxID=1095629 RepID=A0A0C9YNQ4_9AGAR|nr:hypothetical protein K443DRAFT_392021 [Laccaria amethystina LaAM-08-1]